jgi:hypothetical protein
MPKPVILNTVPVPFGSGYLWIAAFHGNEQTGPFGHGDNPTEAINRLVDATEQMLADEAAA